jgi:predicted nucleic acid-binding protein
MLLDTAGLLCFFDEDQPFHEEAGVYFRAADTRLTHSYVVSEFIALAHSRNLDRRAALDFLEDILASPQVEIVWVDERLNREAMNLLRARPDKSYSLCDAVSFVLMHRSGLTEALTTDRHFEQEGFRRLLVSSGRVS